MLGLHLIDTTPAGNRQVITLKVEAPASKEGNELLSCGFAELKTVPAKQNLTVIQKHRQQLWKSFHTHQTSFCSLYVFGCLFFFFFHLFHAYMHVLILVFLLWHPALKPTDTCCIHGSACHITSPQHYLFLKHRWTILNVKFPHYYFKAGESIKLIIHNNYCKAYTVSDAWPRLSKNPTRVQCSQQKSPRQQSSNTFCRY